MEREIEELREYYKSGKTRGERWRRSQLMGLLTFLEERETDILKALKLDIGKHPVESYRDEVGLMIKDIKAALDNLTHWMSSKKIKLPLIAFPTKAELVPQPLGLVFIISSWNFPIGLSLEPLIGAIAAGNTAVLKPSELAPATSHVLTQGIHTYLDNKAFKVVQGGADVCQNLLQYKWDKIFFTGSRRVGQIVSMAAAKHLTPVVLELGGKCPAIVDHLPTYSWERKIALNRMMAGKFGTCNAQACLAIDYILVEETYAWTLIELIKDTIKNTFGDKPNKTCSVAKIINEQHFKRLRNLLDETGVKASVVYGGSMDEENLFIEPTILLNPPLDAGIMNEEIFGPLLPIVTLRNIEDSIGFMNSRPKPLAIYCYTKNDKLKERIISETSSGSIIFNDTIIQYAAETIPFGGIGESGFGRYHGKFSFDEFTHEKPVAQRSYLPDVWFRYPPWNDYKLMLFRLVYVYDYLGIFLAVLGLKKPRPLSKDI